MEKEKISDLLENCFELDNNYSVLERLNLVNQKSVVDVLESKDELDIQIEKIDDPIVILKMLLSKVGQETNVSSQRFLWFKITAYKLMREIDFDVLKDLILSDDYKSDFNAILFIINLLGNPSSQDFLPILEELIDYDLVKESSLIYVTFGNVLSVFSLKNVIDMYKKLISYDLFDEHIGFLTDNIIDFFTLNHNGFGINTYIAMQHVFGEFGASKDAMKAFLLGRLDEFQEKYDNIMQNQIENLQQFVVNNIHQYIVKYENNGPFTFNEGIGIKPNALLWYLKYSFFSKSKKEKMFHTLNSTNQAGIQYIFNELLENTVLNISSLPENLGQKHCGNIENLQAEWAQMMKEYEIMRNNSLNPGVYQVH